MDRTFTRLQIFFFGLFLLAAAGAFVYHVYWVKPWKACEARGGWWAPKTRVCARPIDITEITGRPRGAPRETPQPQPQAQPQP